MMLRATETPKATPIPASPPIAIEAAAATISDLIVEVSEAQTVTEPKVELLDVPSVEFWIAALVCVPIWFNATAPPPATETAALPAPPTASAAAAATVTIEAFSIAVTLTLPVAGLSVVNSSMSLTTAETGSVIVFWAMVRPMATGTPAAPPKATATATDAAVALMMDVSCASTSIEPATIVACEPP